MGARRGGQGSKDLKDPIGFRDPTLSKFLQVTDRTFSLVYVFTFYLFYLVHVLPFSPVTFFTVSSKSDKKKHPKKDI